jgi:hypothetical protein
MTNHEHEHGHERKIPIGTRITPETRAQNLRCNSHGLFRFPKSLSVGLARIREEHSELAIPIRKVALAHHRNQRGISFPIGFVHFG